MPRQGKALGAHSKQTTLMQRCANWAFCHKLAAGVGVGAIALAIFCLIFWFSVFSGLSSSADFIYSTF